MLASKFRHLLVSGILLFLINSQVKAQSELLRSAQHQETIQRALKLLYNYEFSSARKLVDSLLSKESNHPLAPFWEGLEIWWEILPELEKTNLDERFYYQMKKTDYLASKIIAKHPSHFDALILKSLSNGFVARQYSNRDHWVKSLHYAKQAIEAQHLLRSFFPNTVDLNFGDGLQHYYAWKLPQEYPTLSKFSWFLPDGDRDKGLQELRNVSQKGLFLQAEALYFLSNIFQFYEHQPDSALFYVNQMVSKSPLNVVYHRRRLSLWNNLYRYEPDKLLTLIDSVYHVPKWPSTYEALMRFTIARFKSIQFRRKRAYVDEYHWLKEASLIGMKENMLYPSSSVIQTIYQAGESGLTILGKTEEVRRYFEWIIDQDSRSHPSYKQAKLQLKSW